MGKEVTKPVKKEFKRKPNFKKNKFRFFGNCFSAAFNFFLAKKEKKKDRHNSQKLLRRDEKKSEKKPEIENELRRPNKKRKSKQRFV